MLLNFITVLLASCALANSALVMPKIQENNFADVLMNSIGDFQSSPERSMACLGVFMPKMQALTEENQENTVKCASDAEEGRKAVDAENAAKRSSLVSDTANICSSFETCDDDADSMSFFNCYSTNADEGTKTTTLISRSATDAMQNTITSNQAVDTQFIACSDKALYTYKDQFDVITEEFGTCVKDENSTAAP